MPSSIGNISPVTPHHVSIATTSHPAMSPIMKLAMDAGSIFTPYSRAISTYTEMRAAFPALQQHLRHAMQGQHHLVQPSYATVAGTARALGQVCSPKSAKAADIWSTGETLLGGELGSSVRSLISTVPLPMPARLGLFAASYGMDALQAGYARNPERVSRQMFSTGSDFGDDMPLV